MMTEHRRKTKMKLVPASDASLEARFQLACKKAAIITSDSANRVMQSRFVLCSDDFCQNVRAACQPDTLVSDDKRAVEQNRVIHNRLNQCFVSQGRVAQLQRLIDGLLLAHGFTHGQPRAGDEVSQLVLVQRVVKIVDYDGFYAMALQLLERCP